MNLPGQDQIDWINGNHPLHIDHDLSEADAWQLQEDKLLDNDRLAQASAEVETELDINATHATGFRNALETNKLSLNISGHVPEWLRGMLYTISPGTFDIKYTRKVELEGELQNVTAVYTFGHWFDALPLLHQVSIDGAAQQMIYTSRHTTRRLIAQIRDHHGYAPPHPFGLFKTTTNQTKLSKLLSPGRRQVPADMEPCGMRVLCSIPGMNGTLFCQNAAHHLQEFDPVRLEPTQLRTWSDINPAFKGHAASTQGQIDPRTGEYLSCTMDIGYQTTRYHLFSFSRHRPNGLLLATVQAPMTALPLLAVTPRYLILVLCPLRTNAGAFKLGLDHSILDLFSFRPKEFTLFYVVSRAQQSVMGVYRAPPCFSMNLVNAFEDGEDVCVDMACYEDDTILHQLTTEALRDPGCMYPPHLANAFLRRFRLGQLERVAATSPPRIPSSSGSLSATSLARSLRQSLRSSRDRSSSVSSMASLPEAVSQLLSSSVVEWPEIHPKYRTQAYRFVYGVSMSSTNAEGRLWDSLVKVNVQTKAVEASWHHPHCFPSHPVFVPHPSGREEDDGLILCTLLDTLRSTSFLLILDAHTMSELAMADLGTLVPISFAPGAFHWPT